MSANSNPVMAQAISAGAFIALVKAILAVLIAFHVFNFNETQNSTVSYLVDTGVPFVAIVVGGLWAARRVTPLSAPTDVDGQPLTRPDNTPAIPQLKELHSEANKINEQIDERRIKRARTN